MDNMKYDESDKTFNCLGFKSKKSRDLYYLILSKWKEEKECFEEMKILF